MHYWDLCACSLAEPCQLTTPFLASGKAKKWGFFPKDRTYRAFLHNKLFFRIAPRDLHYFGTFVHAAESLAS